MKQQMISAVVLLAGFMTLISYILLNKFISPLAYLLAPFSWVDKCYVLSLTMVVMAFAVLLGLGDALPGCAGFHESHASADPARDMVLGQGGLLRAVRRDDFAGHECAGHYRFPPLSWPISSEKVRSSSSSSERFTPCRLSAWRSSYSSRSAFIQGVLMTFLPDRLFRKMAVAIRFLLLTAFIVVAVFLFMEILGGKLDRSISSLPELKAAGKPPPRILPAALVHGPL